MPVAKTLLIIFTLCSSQSDWQSWHDKMDAKCVQYVQDNETGSKQSFLNREVTNLLGNIKQSDESVKNLMYTVALYHEYDCELPEALKPYVQNFGDHLCDCVVGHIKKEMGTCRK